MTREEALEVFSTVKERSEHFKECGCRFPLWTITDRDDEAIDMAIEALQDDVISRKDTVTLNSPISIQADMVAVVRCKDCKNRMHDEERELYYCMMYYGQGDVSDNNYCQWGERKGGGNE